MRWIDIVMASLGNLWRRKLRSVLTMLGVVIGTAAIVVTMSLGAGAEKSMMDSMQKQSDLRVISVSPQFGSDYGEGATGPRITKIDDRVMSRMRGINHVMALTPMVYFQAPMNFTLRTGKLETYMYFAAVYPEDFKYFANLSDGRAMGDSDRLEFVCSPGELVGLHDPKDRNYQWPDLWQYYMEGKEPPIPIDYPLRAKYEMEMSWYDYSNVTEGSPDPEQKSKEFDARLVGITKFDYSSNFSSGYYVSIRWLKRFVKDNQKLLKDMSFTQDLGRYDQIYVMADSVDNVLDVVKELKDMGVQAHSNMQYIDEFKKSIRTTQAFLGAVGAISLLVAALSIANTMMMSIYERTREIGVMKVLGCKMGNIRMLFISEAAFIGIFGGILGLLLSGGLSYGLNNIPALKSLVSSIMRTDWGTVSGETSIISFSLAFTTWCFVVGVSVASGLYPAQRAMKLSSLEAIRNTN